MRMWLRVSIALSIFIAMLAIGQRDLGAQPIPDCDRMGMNLAAMELRAQRVSDAAAYEEVAREYCPAAFETDNPFGDARIERAQSMVQGGGASQIFESFAAEAGESIDSLDGPTDTGIIGFTSPFFGGANDYFSFQLDTPGALTAETTVTDAKFVQGAEFIGVNTNNLYIGMRTNALNDSELRVIDLSSGTVTEIGLMGINGVVEDLAYNPIDCQLYMISGNGVTGGGSTLWTVDVTNGEAEQVASITETIWSLAIDDDGTFYGVDVNDVLFTIDPGTGLTTNVGATGLFWFFNIAQAADIDPSDGTLYLSYSDFNSLGTGNGGALFTLDKNNGQATAVGALTSPTNGQALSLTGSLAVQVASTECETFIEVDPNRQLGGQVHLPILNFQGQDDVCRTWIEVQYLGCDPSKAVLVTWGEPGFCPPQAAGPLKVECTGLLNPGSTWNLLGAQIPTGSKSGILFKFTAKQLSEVGLADDLGFDDVVADLMCETLFFGVVGDSDDYRRFKKAYNEGLDFAGINQRVAAGAGVLAVEVLRHCPGDVTPGVEVSSRYNGIAGTHLGHYDPIFGGHGYYVPLIYAEKAGLNTVMYIQNGGLECSSVEIWFKAQDDCLRARICEIFTLAPGESYQWDASDCVGPDWQGSAWLRSSQVMGIAVDIFGRDILMTYTGEPQPFAYVVEVDDEGNPVIEASPSTGERVAYGPLMYSEYQGWDTGVQVQNLSEYLNAKVKVYFLDRSGDVITTLVDWICPRGSQTFFLPVVADLPGTWVGSIRIESQDWWTPGTNPIDAPSIVGVAQLMKYSDVARTEAQEAIAYNLLPEHKSYIWQIGSGNGGLESGVGLIAIPSLLKDLDNTGTTSEIAIMNLVTKPGFTDFAIYIYDQNGLLDFVCQKLHDRQVEYIDLQTWGYVNNGFKGSAIISATFWEHEVFVDPASLEGPAAGPGVPVGNLPEQGFTPDATGGPDTFGYTFTDSAEPGFEYLYDYVDISTSGTTLFSGSFDDAEANINVPFSFDFYGVTDTTAIVNTNGYLSFTGTGSSDFSNDCIPDTFGDEAYITPYWDDLQSSGAGAIYEQGFTAGNCPYLNYAGACYIVQYDDVGHFGNTGDTLDFEIILLDDDVIITQVADASSELGSSATAGIENQAGNDGLEYSCNVSGGIVDEVAVAYVPPGGQLPANPAGGGGAGETGFVRNLVGLGAVSIERTGTRLNEDVPGDEAAGSRGIPFAGEPGVDICLGGGVPACPGQPNFP